MAADMPVPGATSFVIARKVVDQSLERPEMAAGESCFHDEVTLES